MGGIRIEKLYRRLNEIGDRGHTLILHRLLQRTMQHTLGENSEEQQASESMYRLLEEEIESVYKQQMQAEELQTHVHLVFSLSNAGSLKVALSRLGKREENKVLAFNDFFSVGPIADLHTVEGQQHREMWLMEHDRDSFYACLANQEHQIIHMIEKLRKIQENKTVVIWCADNAHDQTGLRFALFLLRERKAPVHIVNLTKILEKTGYGEKGKIPFAQSLIDYDMYLDIVRNYSNGFLLDGNQRKQYVSEWIELAGQDHLIRLWEQGKVLGCDESQMDEVIIQSVIELQAGREADDDFVKAGEVLERVLENSQQLISYTYILNRIWSLVNDGLLLFKGMPNMMHQFSVGMSNVYYELNQNPKER